MKHFFFVEKSIFVMVSKTMMHEYDLHWSILSIKNPLQLQLSRSNFVMITVLFNKFDRLRLQLSIIHFHRTCVLSYLSLNVLAPIWRHFVRIIYTILMVISETCVINYILLYTSAAVILILWNWARPRESINSVLFICGFPFYPWATGFVSIVKCELNDLFGYLAKDYSFGTVLFEIFSSRQFLFAVPLCMSVNCLLYSYI